jgi:hypothetical protein
MFLTSPIYTGGTFRVEPADLVSHISWMASVNAKLPSGSNWTMEVGHNGNGNIGVCDCCVLPCVYSTTNQTNSSHSVILSLSTTPLSRLVFKMNTADYVLDFKNAELE